MSASNIGFSNEDGDVNGVEDEVLNDIDFDDALEIEEEGFEQNEDESVKVEIGMEFVEKEHIYELYNAYGRKKGFGIRRRNARPNYVLLTCSRYGVTNEDKNMKMIEGNKRLSSIGRIGCKAALHAYKEADSDTWRITKFSDVHNHEMVSPRSITLLKSHKKMSKAAKSLTESFSKAGIPIARVPQIFSNTQESFEARDCYNHMQKIRRIIYEAGDAQAVQVYCTQQHELDPNFFYSIQFDDESRMLNFCWIDSRSRHAYENFGDVITFDTTYRTNKYSMPFAPFVGINHHLQSMMFGCALLHDETEETFTWLFQTWLSAMKGKKPKAIITDQDIAMGNAIAKVFPEAKHRLCIWHIMRKFPEKLSHVYHEHSNFKKDMNECIYKSKSFEGFEQQWNKIIETYDLKDHEWLKGLYAIRTAWVPIFNRSTFYAGMSTTQRSESINSFFNAFVHSGTTLREFVGKYDAALDSRYESYRREEFDSRQKERRLVLNMPIEEHASTIYTRNVFARFHQELETILKFSKEKVSKVGNQATYRVWNKKDHHEDYTVVIDIVSLNVTCTCMLFEFMGILCRHILAIFHAKNIEEIPEQYILQRWKKDGNKFMIASRSGIISETQCLKRFELHQAHEELVGLADLSDNAFKYIQAELKNVIANAKKFVTNEDAADACVDTQVGSNQTAQEIGFTLKDPQVSQTKGRKRIKSGIELSGKHTNVCSNCGVRGHNKRGCKIPRKEL